MNNKKIRLTESNLHKIIKESVLQILNEIGDTPKGQYAIGAVAGKYDKKLMDIDYDNNPEEYNKYNDKVSDCETYAQNGFNNAKNPKELRDMIDNFNDGHSYGYSKYLNEFKHKKSKKSLK
jgi:hypothetical protein